MEDVHKILTKYQAEFIILEDSICLAPSRDGCRIPDIVDIDNGVVSELFDYLWSFCIVQNYLCVAGGREAKFPTSHIVDDGFNPG